MKKAIDIALNDLRLFFVNRGNLIGLVVVPVMLTFLIGIFLPTGDGDDAQLRVDVIDLDGSQTSTQFIATLRQTNDRLVLCPMDNDAQNVCQLDDEVAFDTEWASERVEASTSLAMIEIPAGFGAKVEGFEAVKILYLSDESFTAPGYIRQAVEAAIQRVNGAVVASQVGSNVAQELGAVTSGEEGAVALARGVYDRAAKLWDQNPVRVNYELTAQDAASDSSGSLTSGFAQSVPGMGTMYAMFTVFGGMIALVGERKQWTLQRLVVMPVTRAQLLGGKILSRFVLGLIQYLVVFAVGVVVGLNLGDALALLTVMIAFLLAITSVSFALGTRLETEAQAAGLTNLLGLTLAPLGGAWWPLEIVPDFMRVIGHISPVAWAMDGFQAVIWENGGVSAVAMPAAVLFAIAVVGFGIGIRRFRYD